MVRSDNLHIINNGEKPKFNDENLIALWQNCYVTDKDVTPIAITHFGIGMGCIDPNDMYFNFFITYESCDYSLNKTWDVMYNKLIEDYPELNSYNYEFD